MAAFEKRNGIELKCFSWDIKEAQLEKFRRARDTKLFYEVDRVRRYSAKAQAEIY